MKDGWGATLAYYAVRGILPSTFLSLPKLDQLFLFEAMRRDVELQNKKFVAYAKIFGAKVGG